jgi:hypothetical protein
MSEPLALNPLTGAYETKTQYETSLRRAGVEVHHRFESLNPAHEGRLRRHVNAATAANDRGDTASVRSHLAAMRTFLDGLMGLDRDGDDDQDEQPEQTKTPKTPRRSRGNQPTVDQPWTSGESTEQMMARVDRQTLADRLHGLNLLHARWNPD